MNPAIESDSARLPVVVVGAGLAGLCCACRLVEAGLPVLVIEADDRVGGRVKTDQVERFQLDRGFQVFLTAYPEAPKMLDYQRLRLAPFYSGALIQIGAKRYRFADPWRHPVSALGALRAPVASVADALRIARMRAAILKRTNEEVSGSGPMTRDYLLSRGLSERVINRFFRPFFGGVFLDRDLHTSSQFFEFVFGMFARGSAALPEKGMQAIPRQIADKLPDDAIRFQCRVDEVGSHHVRTESGERIDARAVVVATDANQAARLVAGVEAGQWNGTTTVYFAAQQSPLDEPVLLLNGTGEGLVNHVCVPSDVVRSYSPDGAALISVSIIGVPEFDDRELQGKVRAELGKWFGACVEQWRLLRIYRIRHALPRIEHTRQPQGDPADSGGVIMCGDYLATPSINGAMASGRKAAEQVIASLSSR